MASPVDESSLFEPLGDESLIAFVSHGTLFISGPEFAQPQSIAIDERWKVWATDVSPTGDRIAALVSSSSSAAIWKVLIFEPDGSSFGEFRVVGNDATPSAPPDVVTTGSGGIDWSPDGSRLAVALPTGGIYRLSIDGTVDVMVAPRRAPRPGDVAWSLNGQAIAYTAQADGRSGFGVYVGAANALPIDPVTILRPDPTGNRSAREVTWTPGDDSILVILDRREMGGSGGDVMEIPARGGLPTVVWSSGMQFVDGGAELISLSPNGRVLSILSSTQNGDAQLVLQQFGGPTEARRGLGTPLVSGVIGWTSSGAFIAGTLPGADDGEVVPVALLVNDKGEIEPRYAVATPEPVASPVPATPPAASPAASPVASPLPATPVASPLASPVPATPEATQQPG